MGPRHRRRRSRFAVVAILGLCLLAPLDATALDSDLKGSAVFRLEAGNGYTIIGFAGSERIDGSGSIALLVRRGGAAVWYVAPATVTPTRLEADLGALGEISAEIVPSGRKKTLRSPCSDDVVRGFEPNLYRGSFEFHGELDYTDAAATDVREYTAFYLAVVCPGRTGGEGSGPGLPGARLRAFSRHGDRHVSLQLNKNRPGRPTFFEATLKEERGKIRIERTVTGRQPAAAFEYDPLLRKATVAPSAPFSGVAHYRRDAAPANRWTGTLSVDFPGKANVPLAGTAFSVHVVHAKRAG